MLSFLPKPSKRTQNRSARLFVMNEHPSSASGQRPLGPWGWLAVVVLLLFLAVAIAYAVYGWTKLPAVGIPLTGWLFLIAGIVVTVLVGGGLMALLFYSSRKGRDI
jgi:hypothetical protein